jgi:accessory gene regulator protein AgrB
VLAVTNNQGEKKKKRVIIIIIIIIIIIRINMPEKRYKYILILHKLFTNFTQASDSVKWEKYLM